MAKHWNLDRESELPDAIKDRYDSAVAGAGSKLWQGVLQVGASGFGKGVLIAAAVVVASVALWAGGMGAAHLLKVGGAVVPNFETGVSLGVRSGLGFLTSGVGLLTLGVGGALGAVSDVRKNQNKVNADIAQAQAMQYELAREMQLQKAQQIQPAQPAQTAQPQQTAQPAQQQPQPVQQPQMVQQQQAQPKVEVSFCDREQKRRDDKQQIVYLDSSRQRYL